MHYRATVKAERCVVCGDEFPNLHNHYRAHLQNRCLACLKYFTSSRLFAEHECAKPDADPTKVFTSEQNLTLLINTYVPKDDVDEQKHYGQNTDHDDVNTLQEWLMRKVKIQMRMIISDFSVPLYLMCCHYIRSKKREAPKKVTTRLKSSPLQSPTRSLRCQTMKWAYWTTTAVPLLL